MSSRHDTFVHKQRSVGKFALPQSRSTSSGLASSKTRNVPKEQQSQRSSNSKLLCSFCQSRPAALEISGQVVASKPLCLEHYYTTRAVTQYTDLSRIRTTLECAIQLPAIQELFSQAFVELKRELAHEMATMPLNYTGQRKSRADPLSILSSSKRARVAATKSIQDTARSVSIRSPSNIKVTTQPPKQNGLQLTSNITSKPLESNTSSENSKSTSNMPMPKTQSATPNFNNQLPQLPPPQPRISRDPLASLSSSRRRLEAKLVKKAQILDKQQKLENQKNKPPEIDVEDGGFFRDDQVRLPKRFVALQEKLFRERQNANQPKLDSWIVPKQSLSPKLNPYQRRKTNSQTSYWAMDGDSVPVTDPALPSWNEIERQVECTSVTSQCPSCKSCKTQPDGAVIAKRNGDIAKGETWGNKDRADSVFHKLLCRECGTTWNEEE